MAAESPRPLDEREQRTLDALACRLAHHDPAFAARMQTGRPDRGPRTGLAATTVREVLLVAVLILLAVVVGVGALVVGSGAIVVLGLLLAGGTGAMAAYRLHQQSRES